MTVSRRLAFAVAILLAACTGDIIGPSTGDDAADGGINDPCQGVGSAGVCDGSVLSTCVGDEVVTTDCVDTSQLCGLVGAVNVCTSECILEDVSDIGSCASETDVARCVEGAVELESCADGAQCFELAGGPVCLTQSEACGGIGPQGHCSGDVLTRCDTGWPEITDCASTGAVCGYAGDDLGYTCDLVESLGAKGVTGVVEYEDRYVSPGELAPPTPRPARGVTVYLIRESDDDTVASAVTADDGTFVLRHDQADGTALRVTASTRSDVAVRPLRVQRSSGNVHGFRSETFEAIESNVVQILATEDSGVAQGFNVFDELITGLDYARYLGATSIARLTAQYQKGVSSGSYYNGGSNFLNVAGDDGYDDVVILHEFGHYHQDEYGASDNPGGSHPSSGGDSPLLAWGEGHASYVAMAIRGVPYYIDYNPGGGWSVDLEGGIHDASLSGSMSQYIYEWMVAELMWDVGDDGMDDDQDPMSGVHDDAMLVTTTIMPDEPTDRGRTGVDLVDWLDGWFVRMGLDSCDAMRELVTNWYEFPYDFAGAAGACPEQ